MHALTFLHHVQMLPQDVPNKRRAAGSELLPVQLAQLAALDGPHGRVDAMQAKFRRCPRQPLAHL